MKSSSPSQGIASCTTSAGSGICDNTALNTATTDEVVTTNNIPKEYFRKDYQPSNYLIDKIYLSFDLTASDTYVTSESNIILNNNIYNEISDLVLDGEELELVYVKINNNQVDSTEYTVKNDKLTIPSDVLKKCGVNNNEEFKLITKVLIHPDANRALSGLYSSGSELLCTQCEAMGFRRITYHLDRPDVLTKYTVRLEADKTRYPILLSNGNQIDSGDGPEGTNKHWAVWEDPFPKPSYLFAVVAGNLGFIESTYKTMSGRNVKLGIYSNPENVNQLEHAMYSIKESMKWDEETFGLECDLDVYNIVATNDFNMGAMENKGLNVFNSAYVLADPKTATDVDFENILGVIGHEYFHNWSGNRVTVRDWFQLTLKEGLTVFRDQWFTSDKTSRAVKRIKDVRMLRSRQFAEDAGPMAHPIRPESYISMDNFYTGTVYIKGAEVVGLYKTLLGENGFKKGLKLYFERHDGTAITCDDFRNAMADANNVDLSQMERWYSQAGTPVVTIEQSYDPALQQLELTLHQYTPSTPNQSKEDKLPLLIPIVIGLLDSNTGKEILPSTVLQFNQNSQTFKFENIPNKPVLSALRDFSAPVNLEIINQSDEDLLFLMAYDTDNFNKWDAGNRYFTKLILSITKMDSNNINNSIISKDFINAIKKILIGTMDSEFPLDPSIASLALQLPDEMTLMNQMPLPIDIEKLHTAHKHVKNTIATELQSEFEAVYDYTTNAASTEYQFNPKDVGLRRLRNTCLDYLSSNIINNAAIRAKKQFDTANCMTDKLSALSNLVSMDTPERDEALETFLKDANNDQLVINKWFAIQANADTPNIINNINILKKHPDFTMNNPNRARSLITSFCNNIYYFHSKNGEGYKFLTDCILELDPINPQITSRMVQFFAPWKKFDENRSKLMKESLEKIKSQEKLSRDTYEVVQRCLE